jgi:hypothetical protein
VSPEELRMRLLLLAAVQLGLGAGLVGLAVKSAVAQQSQQPRPVAAQHKQLGRETVLWSSEWEE